MGFPLSDYFFVFTVHCLLLFVDCLLPTFFRTLANPVSITKATDKQWVPERIQPRLLPN
jgi:hypothetical protein